MQINIAIAEDVTAIHTGEAQLFQTPVLNSLHYDRIRKYWLYAYMHYYFFVCRFFFLFFCSTKYSFIDCMRKQNETKNIFFCSMFSILRSFLLWSDSFCFFNLFSSSTVHFNAFIYIICSSLIMRKDTQV